MTNTELLEALQDARARREKDYQWEKQRLGNGGSRIAMSQARRDADAIAIAAIRIGNETRDMPRGPRWYHWALIVVCVLAAVALTVAGL